MHMSASCHVCLSRGITLPYIAATPLFHSLVSHYHPLMSMDSNPNMYPILIPPASNILYFCHHPTASSQPTPTTFNPSSSMATSNIELTQFPKSQFSWDSEDSPPCFAHLLFQLNDPVHKMTHAIGDTVQFETYPDPCIFLGMKWTAPVDNGAWRECEAEFGVSRITTSAQPPWHFFSNFKIKFKEIVFASPSVFYHGNGSRISSGHIAIYDLSLVQDAWHSWQRHLENDDNEDC